MTTTPKIKLTKAMRGEFVASVLADIKDKIDHDAIIKMVTDEALAALPKNIRALWEDIATRRFVAITSVHLASLRRSRPTYRGPKDTYHEPYVYIGSVQVPGYQGWEPSLKLKDRVLKMQQDLEAVLDAKEDLAERLPAMVATCKTVDDLEDMFPLLTKYIPKPVVVPRALVPAVQIKDTMAQLRKLGVPPKVEAVAA